MSGAGLAWTGGIGAFCAAAAVLSFDPLRRRLPAVFEYRRLLNAEGTHRDALRHRVYAPPNPSRRPFGWAGPCAALELRALARTHGLDAALHLRFLRLLFLLFLSAALLVALPLAAAFFTGTAPVPGLQRVSAARVRDGDRFRLWLAPVFQMLLSALGVLLALREAAVFAQLVARYRQSRNPANYALLARAVPPAIRSHKQAREFWDDSAHGVVAVHVLRRAGSVAGAKKDFWDAVAAREMEEWRLGDDSANSLAEFRERQARAAGEVDFAQQAAETVEFVGGENAAVIIFSTRAAAADAAGLAHGGKFPGWKVTHAPEPDAVNWRALAIAPEQEMSRVVLACLLCAVLALGWTVITAAVTGLSNLDAIVELRIMGETPFSFAREFSKQLPIVRGFAQGFVPAVLLSLALRVASPLHRRIGAVCRTVSLGRRDAVARNSLFTFLVWVVGVAGAGLGAMSAIAHLAATQAGKISALVAAAVPAHAGFVMNFILVQALFGASWALLQVPRVLGRRRRMQRAYTTRETRAANDWRAQYRFTDTYAYAQLVALLGIAYAPVAPAVTACALVYFAVVFPVAKYNLCYATKASYEGVGELFTGALHTLLGSLAVSHLLLAALLGARRQAGPAVIAALPALAVVVAHFFIARRMRAARNSDSGDEEVSVESGVERKAPSGLAAAYVQPEMRPLPDPVENLSGAKLRDGSGGGGDGVDSESFSNYEEQEVAKAAKSYRVPEAAAKSGRVLHAPGVPPMAFDRREEDAWYGGRDGRESSIGTSGEGRSYDWQDSRSSLGGVPFFQNTGKSRNVSGME